MSSPSRIIVEVDSNLRDNPPWDQGIPESLIPELAQLICERFDYTCIYDRLDQLACTVLRERGLGPSENDLDDDITT